MGFRRDTRRTALRALWLALAVAALACGIPDEEQYFEGTGGSTGASGSGGSGLAAGGSGTGGGVIGGAGSGGQVDSGPPCPSCGASSCACVPAVSSGWKIAAIAPGAGPDIPCPSGYSEKLTGGIDVFDAGCSACSCDPPTDGVTGSPICTIREHDDATCANNIGGAPLNASSVCASFPVVSGHSVEIAADELYSPCGAPKLSPLPPQWKSPAVVCAMTSPAEVCPSGVCAPVGAAPFASACVLADSSGDQPCPASYPAKRAFATAFDDKRTCTGCTCVVGGCTGGLVAYCGVSGCSSCSAPKAYEACETSGFQAYKVTQPGSPPSCSPSGTAAVTGTLSASSVRVVCCAS